MRVFRGRGETADADRVLGERLLEAAAGGESAVRVWIPHRQVAFGRRDVREGGYPDAREAAEAAGFPPLERDVGGRAVACDGETTLAFARAVPVADFRRGIDGRYERLIGDLERALADLGVGAERGEPADSFCPGTRSLRAAAGAPVDGKLAGVAQRVTGDAALVAGVLIVDHRAELAAVLEAVYDALGVPFDPGTVGSVAAAGGPAEPERVRERVEAALVGEATPTVERVGERTG